MLQLLLFCFVRPFIVLEPALAGRNELWGGGCSTASSWLIPGAHSSAYAQLLPNGACRQTHLGHNPHLQDQAYTPYLLLYPQFTQFVFTLALHPQSPALHLYSSPSPALLYLVPSLLYLVPSHVFFLCWWYLHSLMLDMSFRDVLRKRWGCKWTRVTFFISIVSICTFVPPNIWDCQLLNDLERDTVLFRDCCGLWRYFAGWQLVAMLPFLILTLKGSLRRSM